jgi:DNA (cytosine-5)-methyltransferase 1
MPKKFYAVELCAGAGGQALGLEQAGFTHAACVEIDRHAAATLRLNRPFWNVIERDMKKWSGKPFEGVDLLAAGLPCPPFSKAGKQLGLSDERNLFPDTIRIINEIRPRAVLIENVRGLLDAIFDDFRQNFESQVERLGYIADWNVLNACDFGVPQLRPRVVFVALRSDTAPTVPWPTATGLPRKTVGEKLRSLMGKNGWKYLDRWVAGANEIAPTLVGGSHKHGGADLGPTRAKQAWEKLGVDGHGLADDAPSRSFQGRPRLTVEMCAVLQGFPVGWRFCGGKTAAYRQVGNAFPPPVARAVAEEILSVLRKRKRIGSRAKTSDHRR